MRGNKWKRRLFRSFKKVEDELVAVLVRVCVRAGDDREGKGFRRIFHPISNQPPCFSPLASKAQKSGGKIQIFFVDGLLICFIYRQRASRACEVRPFSLL